MNVSPPPPGPGVPYARPRPPRRWPWVVVAVGLLASGTAVAIPLSNRSVPPPTAADCGVHSVTYKVDGEVPVAGITWGTDGRGASASVDGATLPWEATVTIAGSSSGLPTATLSADSETKGALVVEIHVDGEKVAHDRSDDGKGVLGVSHALCR